MCEISHVAKSLPSHNDGQNKKELRSDLHDLLNRTSDKLSRSEKQKVKRLVQEYESLFAETDSDLGKTSLVKHEIETCNAKQFKEPPRRTPFHLSKVVNDNIDKMLENKETEQLTINKDAYPLPRIDESLDHLAGNSWFSTLDCCSGYWQVELAEKDKHKTAFATRKGLFQFEHAFDLLKIKLTNSPILTHPNFNKELILDTDASNVALGGVLSQRHDDGKEKVIAYASRSMSKSERRYCVTRKELLAVVYFMKYFKPYLYGRKFTIRTDHSSLRWLLNFKNPEGQVARWIETLSVCDMHIHHRQGTQHRNDDALSRIPCKQCGYTSDWQSKMSSDCPKTEDSQVKIVTSQMPDHDRDLTLTDIQSNDPDLKQVKQWLKGHFTMRHFADNERKVVKLQTVIPLSERKQVLHYCHDAKYAGHLGMRKTLEKIRQSYYWPGLQADVRAYVAGCDKCAMRKTPRKKKRAPMAIVETSSPMERLATDILEELPETENSNRYILVVSDYYTKWTESFPMPNMEASTVVKIIVEEVIARFGVPSWIHSDQGRQYESRLFQEVSKVLDIKKTRTTPYHPQSDGMVERFNKTLVTMLSAYVQEHQRDWDKYIPFVMMAYRASEHETTGQTPNRLMFGRKSTTPLDILYEMPPSIKGIPRHKWAWELKERLEDAHSIVRQRMPGEMRRQKRYHDLKLSYESFRSGDQVYVYFPVRKTGKSPKLTSFWRGPFTILEKSGDLTYKIDCGVRGTPQIIHVDRIKLKHKQNQDGKNKNYYTKKKEQWKCGFCPTSFDCKDERDKHLASSASERLFCTEGGCFYHTYKSKNLLRHMKSKHQKDDDSDSDKEANTSKSKELLSGSSESESEDEWKRQDPGDILGQDSDESAHSDKEEKKDTGLKETENKKDDYMVTSKPDERTVVCNSIGSDNQTKDYSSTSRSESYFCWKTGTRDFCSW
ncbi:unnamed protein product [Mytilus coruscus]|uniref:Integrase catalytic domain-containing protein n=1 Tax=Mytilus coruscus TaxID=42192 RepID=A0A6J8BP86_MYTCO|nr:unnamed protein product [Mytilus coruscus]